MSQILFNNPLYQEDLRNILNLEINFDKLSNSKILITGATGLIGTVLVDQLDFINKEKKLNLELYLVSRNATSCISHFTYIKDTKLHVIEQDIKCPLLTNVKFDFVIHAASNTHPKLYSTDPVGSLTTNLIGTYNILSKMAENNSGRFVLISSVEIYGDDTVKKEGGFTETDFGYLDCNTVRANYCEGKRSSESLCQAFLSQYGVDCVIPRLCRCYGPSLKKDDSKAVSQFLRNGLEKKDIVLKSKGNQFFSYLYASDAVNAILLTMLNGQKGNAYNVADKKSDITLYNLSKLIADFAGTKVVLDIPDESEAKGFSKAVTAILNPDKLKSLGWRAFYPIEEGIKRTLSMLV